MTDGSAYPLHPSLEDARALRREENFRDNELADLPDTLTDEQIEQYDREWAEWNEAMAS